jgi:uncharacterized OB-fold protein
MQDLKQQSPLGHYLEHLARGELAYQYSPADGRAVFYPRVVAPGSGSADLEWRVSRGLGTVHSSTWLPVKDGEPYNVALVDLDEGFRMMTRVEGIDAREVRIGMRVRFRAHPADKPDDPPYAVFVPAEGA